MRLAARVERFNESHVVIRTDDGREVVVEVPWRTQVEVGMPVNLIVTAGDQATDVLWYVEWGLPNRSHRAA